MTLYRFYKTAAIQRGKSTSDFRFGIKVAHLRSRNLHNKCRQDISLHG